MVKPRFVKSIVKDGQVVEDIAPEILTRPSLPQGYQRDTNNFGKSCQRRAGKESRIQAIPCIRENRYCTGFTRESRIH